MLSVRGLGKEEVERRGEKKNLLASSVEDIEDAGLTAHTCLVSEGVLLRGT